MGKKEPHIRVLEGFGIAGGINQEVKNSRVQEASRATI